MEAFGKRVLKRGMQGLDVVALQTKLLDLGFDAGPPNGSFGWLTFEALYQFQKAYGLQVDGVAGRQVFAFLVENPRLFHRSIHEVAKGETLAKILRKYGLRSEALYSNNPPQVLSNIYQGQNIVIPVRLVLAYVSPDPQEGLRSVLWHHRYLTGIASSWFNIDQRGSLVGSIPKEVKSFAQQRGLLLFPVISNQVAGSFQGRTFRLACRNRKRRRDFLQKLKEIANEEAVEGLIFDFRQLAWGDVAHVKRILQALRNQKKPLFLTLRANDMEKKILGDDYLALAPLVDGIIVRFADETRFLKKPGPVFDINSISTFIRDLIKVVPGWKIIIYLPTFGWQWQEVTKYPLGKRFPRTKLVNPQFLTYPQIMRLLQEHKIRKLGLTKYELKTGDESYSLWLETGQSLADKALLVNKYNLAGLAVRSLGWEDQRLWKKLGQNHVILKKHPHWE